MKDRVAILTKKKSDCISLLSDLKKSGVHNREVFFKWEDLWLSEKNKGYDFILIDYLFFDMFRDDMVCYHLFHKYKFKITFYSNISQSIETQKGKLDIDLYRIFFRPFVDFDNLMDDGKNNNVLEESKDSIISLTAERKNGLRYNEETFFLKEGYSLIKFNLNEVLCLEVDRNYVTIYLCDEKHLIRDTLQSMLEILPDNFLRINRSVIINIDKVNKVVGNRAYINGLNIRPVIANKYRHDILNAVPLFNLKNSIHWNYLKKEEAKKNK
ncbi:LytTR family DNA-binding domain-containing protein [Flavivirga aquimarina]|uniref:LytTR family DNA-binding domain-containing protein n=1 Tax=Flavivirga aquimarina TaxID=2027862 RepID=A0ABT8WBW2_9FLAO|nr:LytTR family DNA-binding domain-containing protein [Flavivirga aquimarina]MDO5970639.1 LytTR family DNA-binding domain-containing protein [Flavivirga aquimarina]